MLTNEPDEKLQYACCVDNVGRKPNMQYDPPKTKKKNTTTKNSHTHTETHNILWKPKKQHGPYEVMSNTTVRSK